MKLDPESASPYGVGNGPIDVYIANRHARRSPYVMEEARKFASLHIKKQLLERRQKNTLFLWTYLTHNYDIGENIPLTEVNYRKWCGGNSLAWRDAVDDLLAMGAIEWADTSKVRGSVYRRVV